jgi:hypothetical protein
MLKRTQLFTITRAVSTTGRSNIPKHVDWCFNKSQDNVEFSISHKRAINSFKFHVRVVGLGQWPPCMSSNVSMWTFYPITSEVLEIPTCMHKLNQSLTLTPTPTPRWTVKQLKNNTGIINQVGKMESLITYKTETSNNKTDPST